MTWFRVDDSFGTHPKVLSIPRKDRVTAAGLWLFAGNYSAHHLTDGVVGAHMVDEIGTPKKYALLLVKAGLWHLPETDCPSCLECVKCQQAGVLPVLDGFQFHDWHDHQPSRAYVLQQRASERDRKATARAAAAAKRAAAGHPPADDHPIPYDIRAVKP